MDAPTLPFQRPLSAVERLWVAADRMTPPFVNQLVLEGDGELDPAAWERAVQRVAEVTPGCRVRLQGWLHTCRWVESPLPPPVLRRDGSSWDARSGSGAPFLQERLELDGPTCSVVLVEGGERPRVVIRTHHGVMDGRGHLHFTADLFRVLRGGAPLGAPNRIVDEVIAAQLEPAPAPRREATVLAPLSSRGDQRGVVWARHAVPGRFSRLLPSLLWALAAECRALAPGQVRFDIPVDLRGVAELDTASTANLTGMIHVEVDAQDTVESIAAGIRTQLDQGRAAEFIAAAAPVRYVPLGLMVAVGRWSAERSHRSGHWMASAVASNLGKLPLGDLQYPGFATRSAFFIPPGTEGNPLFLGVTGVEAGIEICGTAPARLGDEGRLEALLGRVGARLTAP